MISQPTLLAILYSTMGFCVILIAAYMCYIHFYEKFKKSSCNRSF